MLFLVISSPQPARPDEVKGARTKFRRWIERLQANKTVISFYPRVGRGAVVIFNVPSNDELHALLTEWANIVPAQHDIYPLATP